LNGAHSEGKKIMGVLVTGSRFLPKRQRGAVTWGFVPVSSWTKWRISCLVLDHTS